MTTSGPLSPALAAYAQAVDRIRAPEAGAGDQVPGKTFAALVAENLEDAVEAGRRSEAVSVQAVVGSADLQDLVEAVNAAELSLQSVVAVRDRIIGAYQDIIRMPI
ncbi:MAG: flagellar hook-basal body complex protein FliE [Geminicoccaceae bacterium]|nr:flagellar hook-basal body complex protein FliE [Geminicoccaceae bacterium]